jgi:recombinational DNA repair ATPase RecF
VLHRLTIHRFRGINELSITFAGKNAAIIGPNGTGKSSVADAIDFLLTGQLRRLTGEGAGGLSLGKHGPHIDSELHEAWVEGEFKSTNSEKSIVLRRDVARASDLQASGDIPDEVQRLLTLAATGNHHMLTRREILRYIFTEPGKRGEQVGALLQLTRIENIRKSVQGAAKEASSLARDRRTVADGRLQSVLRALNPAAPDWDAARNRVNSHRKMLGAGNVLDLVTGELKIGLIAPAEAGAHPLQALRTRDLLNQVLHWFEVGASLLSEQLDAYLNSIEAVQRDDAALKSLRAIELLRTGLFLATENECPLCLREWEQAELRTLLESRLTEAREADSDLKGLRAQQSNLREGLLTIEISFRSLLDLIQTVEPLAASSCSDVLDALRTALAVLAPDPVTGAMPSLQARRTAIAALAPANAFERLAATKNRALMLPSLSGTQQAWDELTGIDNALREYAQAGAQQAAAEQVAKELLAADKLFIQSRDEVLNSTYDAIANRLRTLYGVVHADEDAFTASLTPTKAGLNLEVDFYGRGAFPPCALHSEGHQDSMGLCLFLTLTEYLANGNMPLIVLDDVLMSVDRGHRRAVAEMLKGNFADCQLIITTHDRVWWRQLRTLGIVSSAGAIEFKGWNLEDGPLMIADAGKMLADARQALDSQNVPGAAHALRRAVETYLPDICDALGAPVRYRADGEWAAGDFLQSAMGRYSALLRRARDVAQTWTDKSIDWNQKDGERKTAFSRFSAETWAVNPNVHYTEWADFESADFAPVLSAYAALFDLLVCPNCGSCLRIAEDAMEEVGVRCDCMRTNWNLIKKKSA